MQHLVDIERSLPNIVQREKIGRSCQWDLQYELPGSVVATFCLNKLGTIPLQMCLLELEPFKLKDNLYKLVLQCRKAPWLVFDNATSSRKANKWF